MKTYFKKALLAATVLAPTLAFAGTGDGGASFNPLLLGLVTLATLLMAGVLILANVLRQLARAYSDKMHRDGTTGSGIAKAVLFLVAILLPAASVLAQGTDTAEAEVVESPYIGGILRTDFYFLMGTIIFEVFLMLMLIFFIRILVRLLSGIPEKAYVPRLVFKKNFLDVFNGSVAVEKEEAIVLDHDYDGIRELDNDLPPWWKWGFVLTIIVSFIYMGYYHFYDGPNQYKEYEIAVAKAEEEKTAYLAKAGDQVDENNVSLVQDAAALADAKVVFNNVCAACHRPDGGGNVGPNLTDDYWLHGGSVQDIFKTLKYGWKDKGMPAWGGNLSPKQMANITGYIKSLEGSNPTAPKAPQGNLYVESGSAPDSARNEKKTTAAVAPAKEQAKS